MWSCTQGVFDHRVKHHHWDESGTFDKIKKERANMHTHTHTHTHTQQSVLNFNQALLRPRIMITKAVQLLCQLRGPNHTAFKHTHTERIHQAEKIRHVSRDYIHKKRHRKQLQHVSKKIKRNKCICCFKILFEIWLLKPAQKYIFPKHHHKQ